MNLGVAADRAIGCRGSKPTKVQATSIRPISQINNFYGIVKSEPHAGKQDRPNLGDSYRSGRTISSGLTIEGSTGVVLHNVTASNNFVNMDFSSTGYD